MLLYGLSTLLYDFNMMKGLGKFGSDRTITTFCACAQGPSITILIFRKKRKREEKMEKQTFIVFMTSFYCLKVKSIRYIFCACILILIIIFSFFIYLVHFFYFFFAFIHRCRTLYGFKMHIRNHI